MAEESPDYEKLPGAPLSKMSSPQGPIATSNVGNSDNSNGCVAASCGVDVPVTTGPSAPVAVDETSPILRGTTNVGVLPAAPVTSTVPASVVPLATWTSASDAEVSPVLSGPGAGGVAPVTLCRSGQSGGNGSPRSPKVLRKSRVKMSPLQLESATREEWAAKWREQDLYVECLEAQAAAQEGELACLRDSEEKYRQQCFEVSHRERILIRRLASKEQQSLAYINQITEMRTSQTPSAAGLRSALLDPAVNILVQKLRQELLSTKAKLEDTQNELSAWKFTPDSNTGKRLMAKCRLLYQENEELGRMIASGRIAKLEGELVLQKSFSEEVKKSQSELDEFLQDLDEDVEGMQSTIYFLQQELRKARESVSLLQQENNTFKSISFHCSSSSPVPSHLSAQPPPVLPPNDNNGVANGVAFSSHAPIVSKTELSDVENEDDDHTDSQLSSSGNTKLVDSVQREINVDGNGRCGEDSEARASLSVVTTSKCSLNETNSDSSELKPGQHRLDDPDDSSNDSAALIIKVENEELSDREYDDHETAMSENRLVQRQSAKAVRDRPMMKNESVVGSTNGERSSSRQLLREKSAKREKNATDSDEDRHLHKKKRRESILSLEYTETDDDGLLLTNGESIQSDPENRP